MPLLFLEFLSEKIGEQKQYNMYFDKILMLKLQRNCLKCWGDSSVTQTNLLILFSIWAAGFAMKDVKW
jgi:hypothetical protein